MLAWSRRNGIHLYRCSFILKSVRKQLYHEGMSKNPPTLTEQGLIFSLADFIKTSSWENRFLIAIYYNQCMWRSLSFYVVSSGLTIKCKTCFSAISMEHCQRNEGETVCQQSNGRCSKMSLAYEVEGSEKKYFSKGCYFKTLCDVNEYLQTCQHLEGSTCELNCCDSDGCNGSAMPVISAFLLVICTLLSKMCY